jgi:DNA-binding NarL/FixJ family response regulator
MSRKVLRILVVDDHPLVREGLRTAIRATFATALVEEAGSAPQALASISAGHPDLILLDVNLPGENGIDLARRIRTTDKRVKLLMVAGEADPWSVKEALEAGASGFVTKTRSADFLGQAMNTVLEGETVLCSDAQAALQRAELRSEAATEPPGPAVLSEREREILRHLAHGDNTKTVARSLQISPKTVETHRQHIMRKLGVNSVAALTRYAVRHGLIQA